MTTRERIIDEVKQLPDEHLNDVFNLIHYFRLGLKVDESNDKPRVDIMRFAGSWKDMPEKAVEELIGGTRRRNSSRRQRFDADSF